MEQRSVSIFLYAVESESCECEKIRDELARETRKKRVIEQQFEDLKKDLTLEKQNTLDLKKHVIVLEAKCHSLEEQKICFLKEKQQMKIQLQNSEDRYTKQQNEFRTVSRERNDLQQDKTVLKELKHENQITIQLLSADKSRLDKELIIYKQKVQQLELKFEELQRTAGELKVKVAVLTTERDGNAEHFQKAKKDYIELIKKLMLELTDQKEDYKKQLDKQMELFMEVLMYMTNGRPEIPPQLTAGNCTLVSSQSVPEIPALSSD